MVCSDGAFNGRLQTADAGHTGTTTQNLGCTHWKHPGEDHHGLCKACNFNRVTARHTAKDDPNSGQLRRWTCVACREDEREGISLVIFTTATRNSTLATASHLFTGRECPKPQLHSMRLVSAKGSLLQALLHRGWLRGSPTAIRLPTNKVAEVRCHRD